MIYGPHLGLKGDDEEIKEVSHGYQVVMVTTAKPTSFIPIEVPHSDGGPHTKPHVPEVHCVHHALECSRGGSRLIKA